MADNYIYFPLLNPVKVVENDRANLPKYFTKHLDDYLFKERLYNYQQPEDFMQIWQTTDIITMQFESTFDPIIVQLVNKYGMPVITLPALIGLPNKFYPNTFSFEVNMSLGAVATGCYKIKISAGSGISTKIFISEWQYISRDQIENSLCIEYFNSRFHADVLFETGIKFQHRILGAFGKLDPGRKDERFTNQRNSPSLLNSKVSRQFPIFFGDNWGLTDDQIDFINRVWSCDNVSIDNKQFCFADNSKFEFFEIERVPRRGMKIMVEEGINRNSKIVQVNADSNKKLVTSIIVDANVFGDTSNQGSSNTVPVYNVTIE
jgi:hypothetical protein